MHIKDKIYKFLDRVYPTDENNIINVEFDTDPTTIIQDTFGLESIYTKYYFYEWLLLKNKTSPFNLHLIKYEEFIVPIQYLADIHQLHTGRMINGLPLVTAYTLKELTKQYGTQR